MRRKSILIGAVASGALFLCPALAPAQAAAFAYHDWTGTGAHRAAKPVCTYKGVMSDAEIRLCVGHAVHYHYPPVTAGAAAKTSPRAAASG